MEVCSGGNPSNMTPTGLSVSSYHPQSVSISFRGLGWMAHDSYYGAIEAAIRDSRVFAQIVPAGHADYHLEVRVLSFREPTPGFNMTTTFTAHWVLTKGESTQPVWQEIITKEYTTTLIDLPRTLEGSNRCFMANEGAVRENIAEGLRRLSEIGL